MGVLLRPLNSRKGSANIIGNYTKKDKITLDYVTKRVYQFRGRAAGTIFRA
jgi:hypothetical protein